LQVDVRNESGAMEKTGADWNGDDESSRREARDRAETWACATE